MFARDLGGCPQIHPRISGPTEKSHLIWLHGTGGVGKSVFAFTIADKMKDPKMTEETNVESS